MTRAKLLNADPLNKHSGVQELLEKSTCPDRFHITDLARYVLSQWLLKSKKVTQKYKTQPECTADSITQAEPS